MSTEALAKVDQPSTTNAMSYPIETHNQFIDLRAKGWSLSHIAEELHVPDSTLGDWNKLHREDIALRRAINWERCEASSQLAWEKDLVRLAFLIHHCQDELDRRALTNFSNSELLRLLFSARRDYFKRRDPLLAPLECPKHQNSAPINQKLDSPNKPDKTGQKPDAQRNYRNGNGLHLHKNTADTARSTEEMRGQTSLQPLASLATSSAEAATDPHHYCQPPCVPL
jgi:hypothetical protein